MSGSALFLYSGSLRLIEPWVQVIDILLVKPILCQPQSFAETYKMEIINLQMRHSILMESLVA